MTTNMRVELLRKSNSDLQHDLTEAKERIEQLEPLEEDYHDLQDENYHLRNKLEKVGEEMERLKDANDTTWRNNEELVHSNKQLSALAEQNKELWQSQESALDEAVEYIIKLEAEKDALAAELKPLKERVGALETASPATTFVDGMDRFPTRVYSVDESRPSTSHFDSDYYSQPDSPYVKPSSASVISFTPSERSKRFLDMTEDRRKSARDLVKRMSVASLKALSIRSPSPPPAVPQIPEAFQEDKFKAIPKTPAQHRKGRHVIPLSLLKDEAMLSPTRIESLGRSSPAPHAEGLRGLYRPDRLSRSQTLNDIRPLSSRNATPTNHSSFSKRRTLVADVSPRIPSRGSSKHVHTDSSSEHLPRRTLHHRKHSVADLQCSTDTAESIAESADSEWENIAAPHAVPAVSENDLTTELDPREDKDRWWRNMDRLTLSQVMAQSRIDLDQGTPASSPMTPGGRVSGRSLRPVEIGTSRESVRAGERQIRTTPNTPRHEKDFMFNPAEDEETFLRKAKSIMTGRRQP